MPRLDASFERLVVYGIHCGAFAIPPTQSAMTTRRLAPPCISRFSLPLAAVLLAGCAPYPASQPVPPGAAGVGLYGQPVALQVSFGSASMGRDGQSDSFPRLDSVISREEARTGIRVERYLLPRAGRTGEWTYCMPLRDMDPKRQANFISAVRKAAQPDSVSQVDENQPCGAAAMAVR